MKYMLAGTKKNLSDNEYRGFNAHVYDSIDDLSALLYAILPEDLDVDYILETVQKKGVIRFETDSIMFLLKDERKW